MNGKQIKKLRKLVKLAQVGNFGEFAEAINGSPLKLRLRIIFKILFKKL